MRAPPLSRPARTRPNCCDFWFSSFSNHSGPGDASHGDAPDLGAEGVPFLKRDKPASGNWKHPAEFQKNVTQLCAVPSCDALILNRAEQSSGCFVRCS